jgi:hypothetical protein
MDWRELILSFFVFPHDTQHQGGKKSGQGGVGQGSILKNRMPTRASIPFFKTHPQTNNGWRTTLGNVPSNYTPNKNKSLWLRRNKKSELETGNSEWEKDLN